MPGIEWVNTVDNSQFIRSMNEMAAQVRQTKAVVEALGMDASSALSKIDAAGESLKGTLRDVGSLLGVTFSLGQIKSFMGKVAETRAYFQDIESSMKVFLGSQEKAAVFTEKLRKYAYFNMFEFSDLANASKQMIAYKHDIDTIIPRLDQLSNVARGTNAPLMDLVNSYNKAKNLGGLNGKELQSWAARGLIVKDILKEMGEQVNGSSVSFEQFNKVLDHVTGEGGMFHNLMGEQLSNISAEQGQLEDTLTAMYDEVGRKYEGVIVKWYKAGSELAENFVPTMEPVLDFGVEAADWLIEHYKEIGTQIMYLVAAYGEWKAAMVVTNTVMNIRQRGEYSAQMKALGDEIDRVKKENEGLVISQKNVENADLAELVAKKKLTEEQANLIAAKRKELDMLKADVMMPDLYEKEASAKARLLDTDLQEMLASQKLSMAQAQEIQQRRNQLLALEQEIQKRKELAKEKIQQQLKDNYEANKGGFDKITAAEGKKDQWQGQIGRIDERIDEYESMKEGATAEQIIDLEERINKKKRERIELQDKIVQADLFIEEQEEKMSDAIEERNRMLKEYEEINYQYGTKDEKLAIINKQTEELEKQLAAVKEEEAQHEKNTQKIREEYEGHQKNLKSLNEQLEKIKEQNEERREKGEEEIDTSGLEEQIAAEEAASEALGFNTIQEKANTLAAKAEEIQAKITALTKRGQTIAEQQNTASKTLNTAATQKQTFAERMHNMMTKTSIFFTNLWKGSIDLLRTSVQSLWATLAANPIGAILAGVTMLLPLIMQLVGGTDDAEDATFDYKNEADEAASKVKSLIAAMEIGSKETKAHKDAVNELKGIYEEYGIEVEKTRDESGKEISLETALIAKKDELIAKLREEAIERQRLNDLKMAQDEYDTGVNNIKKDVKGELEDNGFSSYETTTFFSQNVIPQEVIDEATEAYLRYNQAIREYGMYSAEANQAGAEFVKAMHGADASVDAYTQALGKNEEQQEIARQQARRYIGAVRELDVQQRKVKEATEAAARAAGGMLSGKDNLTVTQEKAVSAGEKVASLYEQLEKLDEAKANPEVKTNDAEKAKEDAERAKDKVEELDGTEAVVKVTKEDLVQASNEASDAIEKMKELSESDALPEVDEAEILKTIDDSNEAIDTLNDLDLSESDPQVRDEQIQNAIDKAETALSSMQALDVSTAAPGVDLTGYNETVTKLKNILGLLRSIAGSKVEEGEVQVDGKGKDAFGIGDTLISYIGKAKDKLSKIDHRKVLQQELGKARKELSDWRKTSRTDQEIQDQIKELRRLQSPFTTDSDAYAFYEDEIEAVQAMSGSGRKKAAKSAESARKKREQAAQKAANEARKKAEDEAKRRQREFDLERKKEEEKARQEQDTRAAIEKENIARIKDDGERTRAEEAEQHRLNLQSIDNRIDDMKKKRLEEMKSKWEMDNTDKTKVWADTDEAKKGIAGVSLTEAESRQIKAERETERLRYQKILDDRDRQEKEALVNYLKEYGDYEQKKLALTKEYEEAIRKETTVGGRAALTLKYEDDLRNLESEEFQQSIDWGGAFSSLEGHTKEYLERLRSQLQGLLDNGNLPADQMSVIQEKLLEINGALSEQGNIFSFIGDRAREHNRLVQASADAQEELNRASAEMFRLIDESADAENAVRDTVRSISGADADLPLNEILGQFEVDSDEYKKLYPIVQKAIEAEGRLARARKKTSEATANAESAEDAAERTNAQAIADTFADAAQWVNKYLGDLPGLLGTLGLDGLGDRAQKGLDAVNSAAGAAADFASGNYVGAAMKGISAISSFGEAVGAWSTSNRAEIEKENARLATAMSVNSEAVNRLTEEMAKQSPTEAFHSFEMATAALQANEQATRQTLINNANMYDGGHSLRRDLDDTYVNRIADFLKLNRGGKSWNIVDLLQNTTAEQLNSLYETEQGQELLKGLGIAIGDAEDAGNYNGLFQDLLAYMNDFSKDAYDELKNSLQSAVTGVSFDSFKDGFKSSLMDMEKSAKDFSDDFTQQLMQSVLNAQIEHLFGERIQSLYDEWAEAFNGDDTLTADEVARLKAKQDALVGEMLATRDQLADVTGYGKSQYEQSASQKGWQSMGQETADELNGRFTALQIAGEAIRTNTDLIVMNLNNMAMLAQGNNAAITGIRDMMVNTNSYLEDIVRYAKSTYIDFGEKIDVINRHQEEIYNAIRRA